MKGKLCSADLFIFFQALLKFKWDPFCTKGSEIALSNQCSWEINVN